MDQQSNRKLIILGLAGPVGSGCTEFSKIFDNDDDNPKRKICKCELFKYLEGKKKYLKIDYDEKRIIIDHERIDEEINVFFQKISQIDKKIEEINQTERKEEDRWFENKNVKSNGYIILQESLQKERYLDLRRKLFDELKLKLETRETLKALDELEPFIDFEKKRHHFRRISIADFIIFNAIVYRDKIRKDISKENEEKISKFIEILKEKETSGKIAEIQNIIKGLNLNSKKLSAIEL